MNTEELERSLRNSTAAYAFKATLFVRGVSRMPCPDCNFANDDPPIPFSLKDEKCFQRCFFNVIPWILNEDQTILYEKFRPDKKKKDDLEMAINARKIAVIETTTRRVEQQSPLLIFFDKITKHDKF